MTIKSRVFKKGHENESNAISDYGTGERGRFYFDKKKRTLVKGNPPEENIKYGTPPVVIFDSMPPEYHQAACKMVESRKEWRELDEQHGTITFSPNEKSDEQKEKRRSEQKRLKRKEIKNSMIEALKVYKENPEAVTRHRAKLEERAIKAAEKINVLNDIKESVK